MSKARVLIHLPAICIHPLHVRILSYQGHLLLNTNDRLIEWIIGDAMHDILFSVDVDNNIDDHHLMPSICHVNGLCFRFVS